MTGNGPLTRLRQLIELVRREDERLHALRDRLLAGSDITAIDAAWVEHTLAHPEGIDRLESFGAKLARMQDTIVDKRLPALLSAAGERPQAAIDNLNRAERLGLISPTDQWLAMRRRRNRSVHEYIQDPEATADELHAAFEPMHGVTQRHFAGFQAPPS